MSKFEDMLNIFLKIFEDISEVQKAELQIQGTGILMVFFTKTDTCIAILCKVVAEITDHMTK